MFRLDFVGPYLDMLRIYLLFLILIHVFLNQALCIQW